MLFPSICDVIRNLSGMWQIMFKDKYVKYFDVPQNYDDAIGGDVLHPRDEDAARRPGQARGRADHRRRPASRRSRVYNENRKAVARALRLPRAEAVAGADLRGVPACCAPAACCRRRSTRALVYASTSRAVTPRSAPQRDNARVVLTGSFCEQPPLGLIKSIEMAGCYVVDDDFQLVPALAARTMCRSRAIRSTSCRRPSCTARRPTSSKYDETKEEKGKFLLRQVQDARRRGRDLRRAVVLRPGAARAADAAGRSSASTRFPTPPSSTRRTPARWRRSASRPAPSPIRSSCGAPHEHRQAGPSRRWRQKDDAMWLQKEMIDQQLPRARHRARSSGRKVVGHVRAGQPERAPDVLRLRAPACPRPTRCRTACARSPAR